ncbi:MAG: contractile injection system protein, VgrG/Pvc8 family [Chloroflexota bacterium]|nr:contractile injection system protein, VgrG/Pvc8 family [Chloroflexota bacterium]
MTLGTRAIASLAPDFQVRINGAELPRAAANDLIAATVHEDVNAASMFTLQLINWDLTQLRVTWADDDLFAEGNEVDVRMGYVDNLAPMMVGEIAGLEPEFCAGEVPTLTVRGYDRRHRLLRGRKVRTFAQMKDSDIASQVAAGQALTAQVQDTGVTLDYVLQHNQTDLEFLQDRARRIGYEVVVEDKTLHFRRRRTAQAEALTLAPDADLLEFYPRLSTLAQSAQVAVRGWSPRDKAPLVGEARAGDEATQMGGDTTGPEAVRAAFDDGGTASVDHPVFSQAEADQIASGRFNDMALAYISGEGKCIGRTDLRAGSVVRIDGVGRRFSGLYYVTSATHTYSPSSGYRTAFTVRRNAT